jgi:hypothetical protein
MPSDPLSACETALRSAIAEGRYTEAQSHLSAYSRAIAGMLQALPAASPERREIAGRASRFLAWARHMTLAGQAHIAGQVRQLHSLRRYRAVKPPAKVRTWGMEV